MQRVVSNENENQSKAKTNSVTAKQRNLCVFEKLFNSPEGQIGIRGGKHNKWENIHSIVILYCIVLLCYLSHWRRSAAQHHLALYLIVNNAEQFSPRPSLCQYWGTFKSTDKPVVVLAIVAFLLIKGHN